MKSLLILFILPAVTLVAQAQPTNAPAAGAAPSFQAQAPALRPQAQLALPGVKPNEIVAGKIVYSGSVVEGIKTRKPLQLFNPAAPPQYGSPEDNVARDPINGKFLGLKLFAIRF